MGQRNSPLQAQVTRLSLSGAKRTVCAISIGNAAAGRLSVKFHNLTPFVPHDASQRPSGLKSTKVSPTAGSGGDSANVRTVTGKVTS
jgi:hypothetical protein